MANKQYYVWCDGEYVLMDLRALLQNVRSQFKDIWSARLSTGLFGLPGCPAGNRGPKTQNEVLLAVDIEGLRALVEFGFIPCPVCHPENTPNFWKFVQPSVVKKYSASLSLSEFADKDVLPFDARRVAYEELIPVIKEWPSRLYVPKGLTPAEVTQLYARIKRIGYGSPDVGYYDHASPDRFTRYEL